MRENEIIECDKLIAEFDGWKLIKTQYLDEDTSLPFYQKFENSKLVHDGVFHHPEYHNSWSMIMPVWIKAMLWYRSEFGLLTSTFEINNVGVYIKANSSSFKYADLFSKDAIEDEIKKSIWNAVVEFIKWYNINTKK